LLQVVLRLSKESSQVLPVKLAREAGITYEQLILLQLSRCSRPMDALDFYKCVMNLLALLPPDIRLEVQRRESAVLKALNEKIKEVCGAPPKGPHDDEYYKCLAAKRSEIALKVAEELNAKNYYYIVHCLVPSNTITYVYCQNLLDMCLAVDVLHERGLIGFEEKPLYVGTVNVPRKSDKVGNK
jgi:hypothetical protein